MPWHELCYYMASPGDVIVSGDRAQVKGVRKMTKVETKKSFEARAIASGRIALAQWLAAAEVHGTVYYAIPRVARSGMSRNITLHAIVDGELSRLWPALDEATEANFVGDSHSRALDVVARDWLFSYDRRAFRVGGCGMDMVFWLVDHLASKAGMPTYTHRKIRTHETEPCAYGQPYSYANHVQRTSL